MPTSPPPFLKAHTVASLQKLLASCGLGRTGTKALLYQNIQKAARSFQPLPPTARILSIDLGIKNFAFSLLTPLSHPPTLDHNGSITQQPVSPAALHAWQRLDLTQGVPLPSTSTTSSLLSPSPSSSDLTPLEQQALQDFSPAAMSSLTYQLVTTHLLPLNPTHVLIERQRFRSSSGVAIQEWTIRVNTLEAMLHACFATLSGLGKWQGELFSVSPQAIARYLFPDAGSSSSSSDDLEEDGADSEKAAKKKGAKEKTNPYQILKQNKVSMLGEWIDPGGTMTGATEGALVLPKTTEAEEMAWMFVEGWQRKENKVKEEDQKVTKELLTKLDDLSDSVLQGLVWLQWQRNLEGLIKESPEVLEEEEEGLGEAVKKVRKGVKKVKASAETAGEEMEGEIGEEVTKKVKASPETVGDNIKVETEKKKKKSRGKPKLLEADEEAGSWEMTEKAPAWFREYGLGQGDWEVYLEEKESGELGNIP
ncbi:mitochondrial resolvase Ydc2 [Podospora australis]|uniref:Mitochondrial resolvase Ydc2 n=1 Tax=Podospora australis TaxID=1536484 RepID=A0AAN7AKB7_9PEZI|nr:mitochondrial resolvase Ydc2 [Podospora australis]